MLERRFELFGEDDQLVQSGRIDLMVSCRPEVQLSAPGYPPHPLGFETEAEDLGSLVTQLRLSVEGTAYCDVLIATGKTPTEALRLLRRRKSNQVCAAMWVDETRTAMDCTSPLAPAAPEIPTTALPTAA